MKATPLHILRFACFLATLPTGCALTDATPVDSPPPSTGAPMNLRAAGASLPYPVWNHWALRYARLGPVRLSYQQTGSGGGLEAVRAAKVEVGTTDVPLTADQLDADALVQFPMVVGGVVPVVNLPGVRAGELTLDGLLLSKLFDGEITSWDAPGIRALNPGVDLPHRDVVIVHRSDASGSGWIFARYLAQSDPAWEGRVLPDWRVDWPVGVGATGNAQVAAFIGQFETTLGFVEYSRAISEHLAWVALVDGDGTRREPSPDAFDNAAAAGIWSPAPAMTFFPPEPTPPGAWPITSASYVLLRRERKNAARTRALLHFLTWCATDGAAEARQLGYAPLSADHVRAVQENWATSLLYAGAPVWTPPPPDPAAPGEALLPASPPEPGPAPSTPDATE